MYRHEFGDPLEDIFDGSTHVVLIVTCLEEETDDPKMYYVDVGLGEPPLHPISYGTGTWGYRTNHTGGNAQ